MSAPPLAVTSTGGAAPAARAQALAARLGLPHLFRERRSLPDLLGLAEVLLIIGNDGPRLLDRQGALRFHLGIGELRRRRLLQGEPDALVSAAGLRPGDRVLDCTLGLAQDALVAARAVGPSGAVLGIEASAPLHALCAAGVEMLPPDAAACAIAVRHGDAAALLPAMPRGAFDAVILDPMFDRPGPAQPGFALLRRHALARPLEAALVAEARRVARRAVVIKGPRHSAQWAALGVDVELGDAAVHGGRAASPYRKVIWARLPPA